jgi:hypothetical protein
MMDELAPDASDAITKGIHRIKNTSIDTLVITRNVNGSFPGFVCHVLGKMERDNQVFTLAYRNGMLFISPRKNILDHKKISIGCGPHIHFYEKTTPEFIDNVQTHVPRRGEYDWKKYID